MTADLTELEAAAEALDDAIACRRYLVDDARALIMQARKAADTIAELRRKLDEARTVLELVDQHERSTWFGPDGEKSKRASWRGIVRKARRWLEDK